MKPTEIGSTHKAQEQPLKRKMLNIPHYHRIPDSNGKLQTNLRLPAELVHKLDQVVPRGFRSRFVQHLLEAELSKHLEVPQK